MKNLQKIIVSGMIALGLISPYISGRLLSEGRDQREYTRKLEDLKFDYLTAVHYELNGWARLEGSNKPDFDLFRNSVNQRLTTIENYAKDCRDGKDLETDAERRACKDFLDWKVSGTL